MITKALTNWFFYALLALFVVFLYGPMFGIILLSFQGPDGGLTFPMNGVSLHWIGDLFKEQRVGDFQGSFTRSLTLGLLVSVLTTVFSYAAGLAFRRGFPGATLLFYLTVDCPFDPCLAGDWPDLFQTGTGNALDDLSTGGASDLDPALRSADYVRHLQPL